MSSLSRRPPVCRLPLHVTAPGKVLLAFSEPQLLDAVIAAGLDKTARAVRVAAVGVCRTLQHISAY